VVYAPHFISMTVLCGMIIAFLSPSNGLFNTIPAALFGAEPINYMGKPEFFRTIYVASGIWQNAGWLYIRLMGSVALAYEV